MAPRPDPLEGSVGEQDAGFVGLESGGGFFQIGPWKVPVERPPITAAGIESVEPVLSEIEPFVLNPIEAEHAVTGPQEPARSGGANHAEKVLRRQRFERVVSASREQIVAETSKKLGLCGTDQIAPHPVQRDAVRPARLMPGIGR